MKRDVVWRENLSMPEKISEFILKIPKGSYIGIKELKEALGLAFQIEAFEKQLIFLRLSTLKQHKDDGSNFLKMLLRYSFWRVC